MSALVLVRMFMVVLLQLGLEAISASMWCGVLGFSASFCRVSAGQFGWVVNCVSSVVWLFIVGLFASCVSVWAGRVGFCSSAFSLSVLVGVLGFCASFCICVCSSVFSVRFMWARAAFCICWFWSFASLASVSGGQLGFFATE